MIVERFVCEGVFNFIFIYNMLFSECSKHNVVRGRLSSSTTSSSSSLASSILSRSCLFYFASERKKRQQQQQQWVKRERGRETEKDRFCELIYMFNLFHLICWKILVKKVNERAILFECVSGNLVIVVVVHRITNVNEFK
jgi:hypothetical protein